MREIKLKAFDRSNGVILEVIKIDFSHRNVLLVGLQEPYHIKSLKTVDLIQYIGLHDKNGTPIYEGDIYRQMWKGEEVTGVIIYGDMARYWIELYSGYRIGEIKITGEIIGNKFESPLQPSNKKETND